MEGNTDADAGVWGWRRVRLVVTVGPAAHSTNPSRGKETKRGLGRTQGAYGKLLDSCWGVTAAVPMQGRAVRVLRAGSEGSGPGSCSKRVWGVVGRNFLLALVGRAS